jgi:toxin-antitoxin system PIN domain toxin
VRTLLDINALIALFDPEHIHHALALEWWTGNSEAGWASCPLTQNGFVRVISGPRYARPRSLADALAVLQGQIARPGHAFWPDDLSIADPQIVNHGRLLGPNQITDAYLLALAVKNGGRLATFDRAVPLRAVHGAEARHLVVL